MKKIILKILALSMAALTFPVSALTTMDDLELSKVDAQALLNMEKTSDTAQGINFFKLSIEALMELNVNIKSLQLGCGGANNTIKTGCDIDISNIALSGYPINPETGKLAVDSTGSPKFSDERVDTSAKVTNPFVEFAVQGNSASTREVVGFRLGADKILGLLTLGTDNTMTPNDGIQSFSGYMKMAKTTGSSFTEAATFGNALGQEIQGTLKALGNTRVFTSTPDPKGTLNNGNKGITVPAMKVNFTMPETIVSGVRMNSATVKGIQSTIAKIPLAAAESGKTLPSNVVGVPNFSNDQLHVEFDPLLLGAVGHEALFKMSAGSSLDNLNLNIDFVQALSMIHNIPLNGTGGYLSLQNKAIHWQGADEADIAQQGWWMSFKDPIQLGVLETTDTVNIDYVLPQVAIAISEFLLRPENIINVNVFEAIGSLLKTPVQRKLNIDVGKFTNYNTGKPAELTLTNKLLNNQNVTPNCFGGYKFC